MTPMSFNHASGRLAGAARQMFKAVARGDADAAWRWTLIVERQLEIALRLADLDPGDNRLRRVAPALRAMRQMMWRMIK